MGMLLNMTLFYISLSFFLWMFGYAPAFLDLLTCISPSLTLGLGGSCPTSPILAQLSLFLFGTAGIVFSIFFPNYVAMFMPFAIALLGLVLFPLGLLNDVGVSTYIKVLIIGVFGSSFIFGIIGWMKGNEM
jgi:hypothetical protein